ncbi:hemerythrin domain-containing protein [Actinomadura barringtoniae]|uniref:Hemerythrin domain-containing protein n=1 Tax=Actinomadura barringtoniae TaxID=1427535 RepID=A0A939PFJ0_9ACTN|nr:hemerythrin domain-containing protein [Actinomadura barringtoniae]MBO2447571.1 hemerythrin domain-containing protein [Actinomadura barringtoniae]
MRTSDERVDTWEMVLVHRLFRREYRLAPGLVRAVHDGDKARAATVAEYLADLTNGLHHHHAGEDDLLWPPLLERLDGNASDLVKRMEAQHHALAALLDRVEVLLPVWARTAAATARDELADVLARTSAALDEHLAEEETELLPLVPGRITRAEWDALGRRGRASLPKSPGKAFLFLGGILQEATPEERAEFVRALPPPVRLMWRLAGERIYQRGISRVRGSR